MRHGSTYSVGLAAVAFLCICSTANAKVVLGQSIDGAKLGMTHAQVATILGKGKADPQNPGFYTYRHDKYQVIFQAGRATSIETFDRHQRTARGLGVGTTLTQLHKRQPGVHCSSDNGEMDCYVGSIKRGHRYTDFFSAEGKKVTGVVVGKGYL